MKRKTVLSRATIAGIFLSLILLCPALAHADTTFAATGAVNAGDVVVQDSTANYGVKTTTTEGDTTVVGISQTTVGAGGGTVFVRQHGGLVAINVTGTVLRGQCLITSNTAGAAKAVDSYQDGVFAVAVTPDGTPQAGQCYASLYPGLQNSGTASGETNTASNQGAGGVGLYDSKSGVDLQFRTINAASNKVTVSLDSGNKEVDIDVSEANFDAGLTRDDEWDSEAEMESAWGAANIIVSGELDTKAELEGILSDVSDIAEADGDAYSGSHDFGGATSLELPNATDVSGHTAEGYVAWDTDDDRLYVGSGAAAVAPGQFTPYAVSGHYLVRFTATGNTGFSGTINGTPTTTTVAYDADSSETSLDVDAGGGTIDGRIILYNTTRGNSRLAVDVDTATNTITTESSSDNWADNDAITIVGQTQSGMVDLDISDVVPVTTKLILANLSIMDDVVTNAWMQLRDYGDSTPTVIQPRTQVASLYSNVQTIVPVSNQKIQYSIGNANSATSFNATLNLVGYWE